MTDSMSSVDTMPPPKRPKLTRGKSSVVLAMQRAGLAPQISEPQLIKVAAPPKADEVSKAKKMFDEADVDGNGVLDYAEFRTLLLSIGQDHERLHPNYIEHFLAVADRDHDGAITFDEFLEVYAQLRRFDELLHADRYGGLTPYEPEMVGAGT